MLEYNLKIRKETISFHFIKWELEHICGNECYVHVYLKTQMYSKKYLNDF